MVMRIPHVSFRKRAQSYGSGHSRLTIKLNLLEESRLPQKDPKDALSLRMGLVPGPPHCTYNPIALCALKLRRSLKRLSRTYCDASVSKRLLLHVILF
jgi:hypothetical protein